MSNKKKVTSIAFTGAIAITGAAATAATIMRAAPTLAASHFSIKNGGVPYRGEIAGKLRPGTTAVLGDTTKNTTLTCKKATASGIISKSKGSTPAQVGFLGTAGTAWSSCTGPFGLTFRAHLGTSTKIIATRVTSGGASSILSRNPISIRISGTGIAATCKATISGQMIPAKFVGATRSIVYNSDHAATLHVRSATDCLGAISAGNTMYFAGTYHVSTPAAIS